MTQSKDSGIVKKTGFQKIDYSDPFYGRFLIDTTNDTLTKSGFSIEYFVLDSTKHDDLYIVWGNNKFKDTFEYKGVLAIGDYEYVPNIIDETLDYLILDFDCAQMECAGRLFLSKIPNKGFREFEGVLHEFPANNIVIYNNGFYTSERDTFFVYNLENDRIYNVIFDKEVVFDTAYTKGNILTVVAKKDEFSNEKYKRSINLKN